jgi:rod shape-determining protein MreD
MIRLIPFALYFLLLAMHEVFLRDLTSIYGGAINLAALAVILVAVYKREMAAMWFGFCTGLVAFAGIPETFGWHALVLALIGLAAYHVRERLNVESLMAKLLLVAGGVLLHNIASLIIYQTDAFWLRLVINAVTGTVYTTIIAWLFFLLKEGRITAEKVRAIF